MRRRTALGALASTVIAACGGGGGGGTVGTADPAGPATQSSTDGRASALASTRGIAAWGDSHTTGYPARGDTPGYAAPLRQIAGARTVFHGGGAGLTSTQIADLQVRDSAHDDWIHVFWYGGNNQTQPDVIKADLARSIATLPPGNDRFLVLAVLNQASPDERRGGWIYNLIVQLNADLARQYGDRYVDIRSYLVGLADPASGQDTFDRQDDVVPTSLRADGVHLNVAGSAAVSRKVLELITAKGW